jgi:gamma-glutamyltranspeptidase/glutathione hydrolase
MKHSIAPGKNVKFHDPTIVEKMEYMVLVHLGSTIITSVLQTILNVYEYMQGAVNAPFSPPMAT